ncbi:MAG: penicillin-binding transpeptidase domain-containing protein, partial [Clostridium sp.]
MNKESKLIYIISLGFMVIIFFIVGVIYFKGKDKPKVDVEKLIVKYFELVENKKYNEMYELISNESKASIEEKAFVERNKN